VLPSGSSLNKCAWFSDLSLYDLRSRREVVNMTYSRHFWDATLVVEQDYDGKTERTEPTNKINLLQADKTDGLPPNEGSLHEIMSGVISG